jgi:hypothetical protein
MVLENRGTKNALITFAGVSLIFMGFLLISSFTYELNYSEAASLDLASKRSDKGSTAASTN